MFSIWLGFIILLFILGFYLFLSVSLIVRLLAGYLFRLSPSRIDRSHDTAPR